MGKEPRFGIQSDLAIRHTLRFANTARHAVDLILSYETTGDFSGGGYYGTGDSGSMRREMLTLSKIRPSFVGLGNWERKTFCMPPIPSYPGSWGERIRNTSSMEVG